MNFKFSNPIYSELKKLNLINDKNLVKISNKTRDKRIKVYQDTKSKVIFLDKYVSSLNYYSLVKYGDNIKKKGSHNLKKITNIKTSNKIIKTPILEDDIRRYKQFKNLFTDKNVLDFGCAWGNFLSCLKKTKSLSGVELRRECLNYIKKKIKKINIKSNINDFHEKFDIVTMFHVLEHIPNQVETLKKIKKKN